MTVPWLMNCPHDDKGWCLDCVVALGNAADEARSLCQWIAETPHVRGSINGRAAQVNYALSRALCNQAGPPLPTPEGAQT
jgi:hypothetical protein